jgi:hypothetical protein
MLLFGLLWIDPNIHIIGNKSSNIRDEITSKWSELRLKSYSSVVLKEDRTIFLEYTKQFVKRCQEKPTFAMVPGFIAIFNVMNDCIYGSAVK